MPHGRLAASELCRQTSPGLVSACVCVRFRSSRQEAEASDRAGGRRLERSEAKQAGRRDRPECLMCARFSQTLSVCVENQSALPSGSAFFEPSFCSTELATRRPRHMGPPTRRQDGIRRRAGQVGPSRSHSLAAANSDEARAINVKQWNHNDEICCCCCGQTRVPAIQFVAV